MKTETLHRIVAVTAIALTGSLAPAAELDLAGTWKLTQADKPAFYVWADVPGIKGIFSDDSFTLLPRRPKTISFTKRPVEKATFADFKKALEVMHLRETY